MMSGLELPGFRLGRVFGHNALACDLLQYVAGTAVWGIYHRAKERSGISRDAEFEAPGVLNVPALVLFWLKSLLIVAAY